MHCVNFIVEAGETMISINNSAEHMYRNDLSLKNKCVIAGCS